jgi:glyoxylase-like metal-dependent hydrolase (beta-lactamase superfamily II)
MAVPLLREKFPKIQVLASHPAAVTLAAEKALALFKQLDESLTTFLSHSGALSDQDRPLPPGTSLIKVDRIVKEGDIIQIEDLAWKVLATPGHSDCSVSLFEPEARALVISDATGFFMPQDRSWWPCYFSDYGAYLASIERLKDLDAEVLCLSHNGALRGRAEVRAYFDDALAATRNYHQQIVVEIGSGKAIRQLAEELGTQIHAQTGFLPVEFFQKNCGLLVKQSLKYAGL